MNFHTTDILAFLLEADESIDSEKDTSVKDVSDKKDVEEKGNDDSKDVEDTDETSATDTDVNDSDESALDDMEASDDGETSDNGNDNDETTSPPHEDDSRFNGEKLLLFASLKEIKVSFEGTLSACELIVATTLPKENITTFKEIKKKITTNISLLNDFLNDIDNIQEKKIEELKQIYKIYISDLKVIDSVLKSYNLTSKK